MKRLFFIWLLLGSHLFGESIHIKNDTIYALIAEIYAADGKKKGSVAIPAGKYATWQQGVQGDITTSQTPYTVIFNCEKSGSQYGIINNVSQAATIWASSAVGPRVCKPSQNEESAKKKEQ